MSLMQRIFGVSLVAISSCTPPPEFKEVELPPHHYAVPLFFLAPEEAHPGCASETVQCNYYSDYGTVFAFRCENSKKQTQVYVLEKNFSGRRWWYHSRVSQDLNNQAFSEYCKSTFENYAQFRKETEY